MSEFCQKGFSAHSHLNVHIRTHTKEKPYQCAVCQKFFLLRSNLNVHIRTYTKEKRLHCVFCDKCFSQRNTLNDHIRTHTKEKLYHCKFCQKCFSKKSDWTPQPGQLPVLDDTIKKAKEEVMRQLQKNPYVNRNISGPERQALKSLRDNNNIVIKQADKGGAVVVWRKDLYQAEAERQLLDRSSYKLLNKDPSSDHQTLIKTTVNNFIKNKDLPPNATNLINSNPRTSQFYMLPKIHKQNIPGRPIISAHSCPTAFISQYLDDLLRPMVEALPTYVKDSSHALNIFDGFRFRQENALIFSMDVSSLYTSISHDAGLTALEHFLEQRSVKSPPTATIVRLTELVLTLNHFTFNDNHYLQVRGVAMGTKFGPAYACLFMGYVEQQFLQAYNKPVPDLFVRYIDDYFGATSSSREELERFIAHVNSFHPALKFTWNIAEDTLPFLDLSVSIQHDHLVTSIHYKATDAHNYLLHSSSHPPKCKESIPYSQLLRLRRICSSDDDFKKQADHMTSFFSRRQYPADTIDSAAQRVSTIDRPTALQPAEKNNQDRIPLVISYHPHNLPIRIILLKHYQTLSSDTSTKEIFNKPPIVAFRRETNISNHVVRAAFPDPRHLPGGTRPCGRNICYTCKYIADDVTQVKGPKGTVFINQQFSCTSTNVIYAIICKRCNMLYIGETKNKLSVRFSGHLRTIKKRENMPVANHFNTNGHALDDISITVIMSTEVNTDRQRHKCEQRLIHQLGTLSPNGMNFMFNAFK